MKYPYGKEVLIVGASSGIGKEAVERFGKAGYTVWAVSRRMVPETITKDGYTLHTLPMDVTDEDSVRTCTQTIRQMGGEPGILLYCAGIGIAGSVEDTPIDAVKRQMETNYYGFLRLLPHVMPSMRAKKNGLIMAVSSVAGLVSLPFQSQYAAGKYALEATVQALRNEAKPYGIRAALIEPGDTKTGFTAYRKMEIPEGSVYTDACNRAVARMVKDEQNGKSPATAAKVALKLAGKKNPPQHNIVGLDYTLLALGIKLFPAVLVEKVMGMLYCK